jgi:hypothetical protein
VVSAFAAGGKSAVFARIVTDCALFACPRDVFTVPAHRDRRLELFPLAWNQLSSLFSTPFRRRTGSTSPEKALGELLERVVAARFFALLELEVSVAYRFSGKTPGNQLIPCRLKIASKMASPKAMAQIGRSFRTKSQAQKKCHRRPADKSL